MDITLHNNTTTTLHAFQQKGVNPATCVVYLSGGSTEFGKDRFREWQKSLVKDNIASISFDPSGVCESGLPLAQSSLKQRIDEAVSVVDWVQQHMSAKQYVLYGVSMGGYVALGTVNARPHVFSKMVLHAPAAYANDAHELPFGPDFTSEIRKEGGWHTSRSFTWFEEFQYPSMLVEAENDTVIPQDITETYRAKKKSSATYQHVLLKGSTHNVWSDSLEDARIRDTLYQKMHAFITS